MLLRQLLVLLMCFCFVACGGSSSSDEGAQTGNQPDPVVDPEPDPDPDPDPVPDPDPDPDPDPVSNVQISGTVTYDFVPHLDNGGLDYDNIRPEAAKGVVVQLLNNTGNLEASTISSETGEYSFEVMPNMSYQVRVLARMSRASSPSWQISVTDNTDNNALYALGGGVSNSGSTDSTRNIHAQSGWTGSSYGQSRAAAPFAMLDSVYQLLDQLVDAGFNQNLVATELRWSVNNIANPGSNSDGNIDTSKYDPNDDVMYILGAEDNDTDEYDRSVIQHEFTHYLEDVISRSNSIGGGHSASDQLDMRVAFSEGLANGVAAAASGTGYYEDSAFIRQRAGFRIQFEPTTNNRGWFSSASVANMVLDIADDTSEVGDNIELGLISVINALSSPDYVNNPALTSVYSFLDSLKDATDSATDSAIDALAADHLIFGDGPWGEGETNDAGISFVLPVYRDLTLGGPSVEVCSGGDARGQRLYNKVENRRFLRFTLTEFVGLYRIEARTSAGTTGVKNPDIVLFRDGRGLGVLDSEDDDVEAARLLLDGGEYVMEVYDFSNIETNRANVEGDGATACFDVTLEEA